MAVDKLVDSTQLNTDLTSVANAIRTKGGTSAQLAFPAGFVSAVQAIPTGGGGTSGLPSTYDELLYISTVPSTDGNPYIETNYTPVQGDEIDCSFSCYEWQKPIYSAGDGTYQLIIILYDSARMYVKYFASGNAAVITSTFSTYANYRVTVNSSGLFTVSGNASGTASSTYGGTVNSHLYIFKRAGQSVYCHGTIGKLIITNNGTDKLKLIPARRKSDDVVGMYDMVSDTFYTNSGSGKFFSGEVVIDDSEALSLLMGCVI